MFISTIWYIIYVHDFEKGIVEGCDSPSKLYSLCGVEVDNDLRGLVFLY